VGKAKRGQGQYKGQSPVEPRPDYLSSFFGAAPAGHALILDDLAIKVVLGLYNAAKEHPAVQAGVGPLEAGVVRLYGVVIVVMGVYPSGVHSFSSPFFCGPEPGSAGTLARLNYYELACEARKVGRFDVVAAIETTSRDRTGSTELNLVP
jgi:hypothetical protein